MFFTVAWCSLRVTESRVVESGHCGEVVALPQCLSAVFREGPRGLQTCTDLL